VGGVTQGNVTQEPDVLANESWFVSRWRPAMAWQYLVVCVCDFIVFPVLAGGWFDHAQFREWHPLTLQGGGLYHLAMGGILGVSAWQRTQEKIAIYGSAMPNGYARSTEETTVTPTVPTKSSRAD
jgi:hypothetical protein